MNNEVAMRTLALVALIAIGAALPARAENLGTLQASWPAQKLDRIRVEFPVGDLTLVAGDVPTLRASMTVRCRHASSRCIERSKRLKIISTQSGRSRSVKVEGYPKFNNGGLEVSLRLELPRSLAADVEMGVGDLVVEGVEGDLSIELGVGDVDVAVRESDVRSVHMAVGIGDATLDHGGRHQRISGFIGKNVRWNEGPGNSRVNVEVGVGDATVRMDQAD
jgi:hypothetical protein